MKGKELVNLFGLAMILVGLIYMPLVVVDIFALKVECTPYDTGDINTSHIDCIIHYL